MEYSFNDIGVDSGLKDSIGILLSDSNHVVLESKDHLRDTCSARYRWSDGDCRLLGYFSPSGINAHGIVVGTQYQANRSGGRPVIADEHGTHNLFGENRASGFVRGINSEKSVIGFAYFYDAATSQFTNRVGYIARNSVKAALPTESPTEIALPQAINDQGWVAGVLQELSPATHPLPRKRGVVWKHDEICRIPIPDGFQSAEPVALNNSGLVLCRAVFFDTSAVAWMIGNGSQGDYPSDVPLFRQKTFVYNCITGVTGPLLDFLGRDINDQGDIAGVTGCTTVEGEPVSKMEAVLYKGETLHNLSDLLPELGEKRIISANAINNAGAIVGAYTHGSARAAFLALPD